MVSGLRLVSGLVAGYVTVLVCTVSIPTGSGRQSPYAMYEGGEVESTCVERLLGGYCSGVPPLPIPNREVKPACADGTAMQCGRVGGRRLLSERVPVLETRWGLFVYVCLYAACVFVLGPLCKKVGGMSMLFTMQTANFLHGNL